MRSFLAASLAAVCGTGLLPLRAQTPVPPAEPRPVPPRGAAERGSPPEARPIAVKGRTDLEVPSELGIWSHLGPGERNDELDAAWTAGNAKSALDIAAAMIEAREDDATGHIVRYLALLELAEDRQRARMAAVQSTKALGAHPAALAAFVDKALFVAPQANEYQLAVLALTPVIGDARTDVDVRIAHIQALLGCGKNREAFVTNKDIVKEFADDPQALLRIAWGICDAENAISLAPLARRAFDRGIAGRERSPQDLVLEFRILNDLEGNPRAAAPVAEAVLTKVAQDGGGLNNWIWYLMVRRQSRGKVDSIALPAAEKMIESGEADSWTSADTVALAFFVNGKLDRALDYQERAVKMAAGAASPGMLRRLEIFRAAVRAARPSAPSSEPRPAPPADPRPEGPPR